MAKLTFLGSGGGRYVMATQARATGGFRVEMDGINIHVDPGPGALVRAKEHGVSVKNTDVVMVSHVHLDHSNDCNVVIDAMTEGAKNPKGILIGNVSAIKGHENDSPAVLKMYLKALETVTVMKAGDSTNLKNVVVKATPTKHTDPTCIGFRIEGEKTISYTSDTEYFPELKKYHRNADLLIINMLRPDNDTWPMHMNLEKATELIRETVPRLCVLQHFGMKVLERGAEAQAKRASKETGVEVIAAEDGMRLDLNKNSAPLSKYIKK